MTTSLHVHLFTCRHTLELLQLLVFMNEAVMHIHVQASLSTSVFIYLGWMPQSGILRSYGKCTFNYLRNCSTCFVKKTAISLLNYFGFLEKNQWAIHVQLCLWTARLAAMRYSSIVNTSVTLLISVAFKSLKSVSPNVISFFNIFRDSF